MNKIAVYSFMLIALVFWGCGEFLDEVSQDEIKPSTVTDLEQILLGDGYFNPSASGAGTFNMYDITDIFTDDIMCNGVATTKWRTIYREYDAKFLWDDNMFQLEGDGDDIQFWQNPYDGIGTCNVVLDYLDAMRGDDVSRENLRGEALVLRSWYYFHLVNLFGMPYNYGDPSVNPGVPLILSAEVKEDKPARNTVREVYEQIVNDMTLGRQLMLQNPKDRNFFRIRPIAAAAMLARVYLYMEEWDKAIAYADTVLSEQSALVNLNTLTPPTVVNVTFATAESVYDTQNPVEIIWGRQLGGCETYATDPGGNDGRIPYSVSDTLQNLVLAGKSLTDAIEGDWQGIRDVVDYRCLFYFSIAKDGRRPYLLAPNKNRRAGGGKLYQGIRTAEVYLIRAEAYAQKNLESPSGEFVQRALADLNYLRLHRIASNYYEELNITDPEELFMAVQKERRAELCGETNNRWFDLRRWGMPAIFHRLYENANETPTVTTIVPAQYALPIPEEALDRNASLVQNIRQ